MTCAYCGTVVPLQDRGDGKLIPASRYWFSIPDRVFCSVEHCHKYLEEHKDATEER